MAIVGCNNCVTFDMERMGEMLCYGDNVMLELQHFVEDNG